MEKLFKDKHRMIQKRKKRSLIAAESFCITQNITICRESELQVNWVPSADKWLASPRELNETLRASRGSKETRDK